MDRSGAIVTVSWRSQPLVVIFPKSASRVRRSWVAGSIYRKGGVERVVKIRAHQELEYDPRELAQRVETMPSLSTKSDLPERGSSTSKAKQPIGKLLVERGRA